MHKILLVNTSGSSYEMNYCLNLLKIYIPIFQVHRKVSSTIAVIEEEQNLTREESLYPQKSCKTSLVLLARAQEHA